MGRVVIRAQHHVERIAGAFADLPQKPCIGVFFRPILEHADGSAVGQTKSGNVQRIGRRMLAAGAVLAAVHIAAGEAAQMIDPRHPLPIRRLRRWLQSVALEQRKGHCQWATGEKAAAQRHFAALNAQGIAQRASRIRIAVALSSYPQPGTAQHLITQLRVVP